MLIRLYIYEYGCDARITYDLAEICRLYNEKERVFVEGKGYVNKVTVNNTLCKKIFKNILRYYEGSFDDIEEYIIMNCKDEGLQNLFREMRLKYEV